MKRKISCPPNVKHVSTSYAEQVNLTMRMGMCSFTCLTNGFSKKLENHMYAISLHFMHYNFCCIHKALRVTPAMEAGISDYVWDLEDIVMMADMNVQQKYFQNKPLPNRASGWRFGRYRVCLLSGILFLANGA
jgi:hypothetical protein